ncbi:MAG: aldo/keto reductase [Candidatus Heimdallarchaeota archaeon]|nr:aldo/keto reductase [Candidatus Heimdallarchaeota archaeon]
MQQIRLGKTGLQVSRVGIGGIPITRPSEEEAIKLIQYAIDLGVNFIDTAYGYGVSEERFGEALKERREEVIIATKGWTEDHLQTSLKRLNTDYIDLWQFHGINSDKGIADVIENQMDWATKAIEDGTVRHLGFSSHSLKIALKAIEIEQFETIQFPLNFVSNEALEELLPKTRELDLGFIAMKPFAGGRLKKAELAIKYLLQFEDILPDPGIERFKDIEEIVEIVNSNNWELSEQEKQEIEEIKAKVGKRFCRQCGYCMPCPENVIIFGVIYLKILYELWPADWYFNWEYVKRSVESAANCVECGICETKCPYELPIRGMIKESLKFHQKAVEDYKKSQTKARVESL